jgi:hypothetical protein
MTERYIHSTLDRAREVLRRLVAHKRPYQVGQWHSQTERQDWLECAAREGVHSPVTPTDYHRNRPKRDVTLAVRCFAFA